MVNLKSTNDIILELLDYYRIVQPEIDMKQGSVARDLFIDGLASQAGIIYDELGKISDKQSIRNVNGTDLDKLAQNFGLTRKKSSNSSGVALFTFSSISSNVGINTGDLVFSKNGFSFSVVAGISITPSSANFYKSIAAKFRDQLDFAGITDQYAALVTVRANAAGSAGNIGVYSLNRTNIPGVSNITNVNPFGGGTDQESELSFKNRILATFSGSSVGTALGYLNSALSVDGVSDASVIEPGDSLMTRDGTVIKVNPDNSRTILSEGSGGKVDIVVLGSVLVENTDSFIYRDKSNNNDPTNTKNNFVLGQLSSDVGKSINKKRVDNLKTGVLPAQPTDSIIQVVGSLSGANFATKTVDSYGRVFGNFELVKDTGVYGGSPWGFDTFKWISNKINDFGEDRIKGQYNSQDATSFSDVLEIPKITQNVPIANENSTVTSNRSIIQLLHTPTTNVTRVFNVNTGEVYVVVDQGIDSKLNYNKTGLIKISGNTLPSVGDTLQVDYNWLLTYDKYSDYDGLAGTDNIREVNDSIDWGYSSLVRDEDILFVLDDSGDFFQGRALNPVGTIVSANKSYYANGVVVKITTGLFINRLAVVLTDLPEQTTSVNLVKKTNTNSELFLTKTNNGTYINSNFIENAQLINATTIILPTDTYAIQGDTVSVYLNSSNVFMSDVLSGSSNGNQITIPLSLLDTEATEIYLNVRYISSLTELLSTSTTFLPASRSANGFTLKDSSIPNNNIINVCRNEHQLVKQNVSLQKYITLSVSAADYVITEKDIISVVRVSDNLELWNASSVGTVEISGSSYNLILTGVNTPLVNESVIIFYYAKEIKRFQPFTFSNSEIHTFFDELFENQLTGNYEFDLNVFADQASGLEFSIFEPDSDIELFSITDGYLESNLGYASISSLATDFSSLLDIKNKKVVIKNASDRTNNGRFDIINYDMATNKININNNFNNLSSNQVSIIRISDGKELSENVLVDSENNKLIFDKPENSAVGENVFVRLFNYKNIKQSPTIIAGSISDQIINNGVITVSGTTLTLVKDGVFTATADGLTLDLSEAIRTSLGIRSNQQMPSNVKVIKVMKVEKVITASITDNEVLSVQAIYDVDNTKIKDNTYFSNKMVKDSSLNSFKITLPSTPNNTLDVETHNLPKTGDKIRCSFYYATESNTDNLVYTKNGVLYTNKKFILIDRFFISSGFKTSQSTKFTASLFTQPSLGARYKSYYDYIAPKQNERIVINYNYNKLINDITLNVEQTRPVNADVLARGAKTILLDLIINVVIEKNFISSTETVKQNLRNKLSTTLTTNKLEDVIDTTIIINSAEGVDGVARARIIYFNKFGESGSISTFQATKDEFFVSNNITINVETR